MKKGKLDPFYYSYVLRNRISKYINNTCAITVQYVKYPKDKVVLYAKCKHSNYECKKFKIFIENLELSVYSSSVDFCHKHSLAIFVKGVEREIVKKKLLTTKACVYKNTTLIESNSRLINLGNLQEIKSDHIVRKIRSEALGHLDRHKNELWDVILMQEEHPEYLQEVSVPFCIKSYSIEQIRILQAQKRDKILPLIYFDATGKVVNNPTNDKKRVYLYSAVVPIPGTERIVPVFEMISSNHYAKTIFKIIHDFRIFCSENSRWPLFGGVVTDFSFANLHAVSKACNGMTLSEYLQLCYHLATNRETHRKETLITVHLCTAHFMKMVSKDLQHAYYDYDKEMFFKDVIAQAVEMDTLEQLSEWFKSVVVLINSEFQNEQTEKSLRYLTKHNDISRTSASNRMLLVEEECRKEHGNAHGALYQSSL